MIITIRLVNSSFTPDNYHFVVFVVKRTVKVFLSNVHIYDTVLLTIVIMVYVRSHNLLIL